jgi:hypothetical protein
MVPRAPTDTALTVEIVAHYGTPSGAGGVRVCITGAGDAVTVGGGLYLPTVRTAVNLLLMELGEAHA